VLARVTVGEEVVGSLYFTMKLVDSPATGTVAESVDDVPFLVVVAILVALEKVALAS
jgi:hypothetical protein